MGAGQGQNLDVITFDAACKIRLVSLLQTKPEIFSSADDPALAALCTCAGLQFELGERDFDRLSPFFGVDIANIRENPWASEIFIQDGRIGIKLWRKDGVALCVKHQGFSDIIDPSSFDARGELFEIVIFPADVAEKFRHKGFELVIVRDWILNSSLCLDQQKRVSYLLTNEWELDRCIANMQARLMTNHQLAFFGTHDVVDHLLGADRQRFDAFQTLFCRVQESLARVSVNASKAQRMVSYLMGVVLDDMAQPRWYGSQKHASLLQWAEADLERTFPHDVKILPQSFHRLAAVLRDRSASVDSMRKDYHCFIRDLLDSTHAELAPRA